MTAKQESLAASPFTQAMRPHITRTKTVATVGPASNSLEMLKQLLVAGVDVFRINMAHGTREDHQQVLERIRLACLETRLAAGIMIDLAGPKIRLG
ncbi:MAG: pyruvate kinase, partial [Pirellulaceae bacterium]